MIKTILVPTDGSEHAGKAVLLASDIAEKYGAKLVFLHVMPQGPLPDHLRHLAEAEHLTDAPGPNAPPGAAAVPRGPALTTAPSESAARAREIYEFVGRQMLDRADRTAREQGASDIATLLLDGDPVKQILEETEKEEVNLIVMGSRGLSDLKGLLMGSVSHKVSHLAKCTCVTVR